LRLFACLAMMPSLAVAQLPRTVTRLAVVKKIFVGSLGDAAGADELRYKIQNRLINAKNLTLVTTADQADGSLKGIAEVRQADRAKIVLQLVSRSDGILWGGETPTACAGATEAVASILSGLAGKASQPNNNCEPARAADLVVKQLLKAIEKVNALSDNGDALPKMICRRSQMDSSGDPGGWMQPRLNSCSRARATTGSI
jgi:hypothetical protein